MAPREMKKKNNVQAPIKLLLKLQNPVPITFKMAIERLRPVEIRNKNYNHCSNLTEVCKTFSLFTFEQKVIERSYTAEKHTLYTFHFYE